MHATLGLVNLKAADIPRCRHVRRSPEECRELRTNRIKSARAVQGSFHGATRDQVDAVAGKPVTSD
jgi:hypothetical protein